MAPATAGVVQKLVEWPQSSVYRDVISKCCLWRVFGIHVGQIFPKGSNSVRLERTRDWFVVRPDGWVFPGVWPQVLWDVLKKLLLGGLLGC